MFKFIIGIIILVSSLVSTSFVYALPAECAERPDLSQCKSTNTSSNTASVGSTPSYNTSENILGITTEQARTGNVDMNTIPKIILSVIETLLAVAGTVSVFSLIYHAVQMQLNSGITGDSSGVEKAKKGMTGALIGFVIAISAFFIVTRAVQLLGYVS